ncbi:MAG: response regulator [Burkholderiales bacterium]|nr:response regulator [Burkholderiales bacterium]
MSGKRALVVDDSKVGRMTMQKKLEALGLAVDQAESGPAALEYLRTHRPDVIFMDHMMPELDGLETTRRIKAVPATRDIPVIIVSGADEADFVHQARAAGALDAITKPPEAQALQRVLSRLPDTTAVPAGATTPPADVPAETSDQTALQRLIETLIAQALERQRTQWREEARTVLEAEIENTRQLQRDWRQRVEQRLDEALARFAAGMEEARIWQKDLQGLRTQLAALRQDESDQRWQRLAQRIGELEQRLSDLQQEAAQQRQSLASQLDADLRANLQALLPAELSARLHEESRSWEERLHRLHAELESWAAQYQTLAATLQQVQTLASDPADWQHAIESRLQGLEQRLAQPIPTPPPPASREEYQRLERRLRQLGWATAGGALALLIGLILLAV